MPKIEDHVITLMNNVETEMFYQCAFANSPIISIDTLSEGVAGHIRDCKILSRAIDLLKTDPDKIIYMMDTDVVDTDLDAFIFDKYKRIVDNHVIIMTDINKLKGIGEHKKALDQIKKDQKNASKKKFDLPDGNQL